MEQGMSERAHEERRLTETLAYLRHALAVHEEKKQSLDQDVDEMLRQYNSENMELHSQLVVGTDMQGMEGTLIRRYRRALKSPYFGRVDFAEKGRSGTCMESAPLYIGRSGITREDSHETLVIDWRTPAAGLYYDGELGEVAYHCAEGEIKGDMRLKRTFRIEDGALLDYYDSDLVTNDLLLQEYLSKNADVVLRDIIATIQKDQNEIIRVEPWHNVIVQGVAGSGKTTVAMHRLAFLIFNFEDSIKAGQFAVVGTNRMFLLYVSGMLPDLGVESIRQFVMPELLRYVLHLPEDAQPVSSGMAFKSGMAYAEALRAFVRTLEEEIFLSGDLMLDDEVILSRYEIEESTIGTRTKPFRERAELLEGLIRHRVQAKLPIVLSRIERLYEDELYRFKTGMTTRRTYQSVADIIDEKAERLKKARKQAALLPKSFVKKLKSLNERKLYLRFLRSYAAEAAHSVAADAAKTLRDVRAGRDDLCDLGAMLYLSASLETPVRADEFRHLVIDEAQDFGPMLYMCLSEVFKKCTFTILGDVSQNLSDGGVCDWSEVAGLPFNGRGAKFFVLSKSYRNTMEIAGMANNVLTWLGGTRYPITPVVRSGEPVSVRIAQGFEGMVEETVRSVEMLRAKGYKNIALICKAEEEAQRLHAALPQTLGAALIDTSRSIYEGGLTVFDTKGVKGLEFDAAVVFGADDRHYQSMPGDIRLLYVALTRALHALCIVCDGRPAALLEAANAE